MLDAAIWKELGAEEVSKSEAFYDALGTRLSRWLLARSQYPEMEAIKLLANADQSKGACALKATEIVGWWFERREITLLSILDECQDSSLYLARSRATTPAVSEMLFDLCNLRDGWAPICAMPFCHRSTLQCVGNFRSLL